MRVSKAVRYFFNPLPVICNWSSSLDYWPFTEKIGEFPTA